MRILRGLLLYEHKHIGSSQICINVPLMKKKLKGICKVLCFGGSII